MLKIGIHYVGTIASLDMSGKFIKGQGGHQLQILTDKKALRKDTEVERVAFNAITKQSILAAMKEPRKIDQPLVSNAPAFRSCSPDPRLVVDWLGGWWSQDPA